jgi:hypothetical protein
MKGQKNWLLLRYSELGAGCSKDGLGQDVPATRKRSLVKSQQSLGMKEKEATSSTSSSFKIQNPKFIITTLLLRVPSRPLRLCGKYFF